MIYHMDASQALEDALIAQIRVELAERNMHQKDLAHRMGISAPSLNRYLRKERGVSMAVFTKMAGGLDMEPWALMRAIEERAAKNV